MAITNAQQYKQLVNPPMKGKKRPGYRGDDAYGGGRDPSGPTGAGDGGKNRERGMQRSRNIAQSRADARAAAALGDPGIATDTITSFGKNLRANLKANPFSMITPLGTLIKTSFQTDKARKELGLPGFDFEQPDDEEGDGQQIPFYLRQLMMAQAPSITKQEPEDSQELEGLRLAFRAEGGIIDEETGRQMYGLGKLVKKETRAVKKVAKSPIGKAALLYTGAAGLGALGAGTGFAGFKASLLSPSTVLGNLKFTGKKLGLLKQVADYGMTPERIGPLSKLGIGAAITAASLLPLLGLGTGEEDEEEAQAILDTSGIDIAAIRANPNQYLAPAFKAEGGRIGYANGTPSFEEYMRERKGIEQKMNLEKMYKEYLEDMRRKGVAEQKTMAAEGGFMKEPVAKKTMPLLDMGGQEMDLRAEGGFVPIGRMEKADDVPARLSKNEFVFTADAVRNAGDGNVDKGAEVMYNMMKNLEAGGDVSKESQGLEGARRMFQTSKRLEEVL